jgi:hypothetical protein
MMGRELKYPNLLPMMKIKIRTLTYKIYAMKKTFHPMMITLPLAKSKLMA